MTGALIAVSIALAVALVTLGAEYLRYRRRRPARVASSGPHRILFPFLGQALSPRALDAALRIAVAEDATLVPVFLASVPLDLPLDAALPRQSQIAMPLQEVIEQRATKFGVAVDARVRRGRSARHALRQAISEERFDRIVVAAAANGEAGFDPEDVAWLLGNARDAEIAVLRASRQDLNREYGKGASRSRRRPEPSRRSRAGGHAGYAGSRGAISRG